MKAALGLAAAAFAFAVTGVPAAAQSPPTGYAAVVLDGLPHRDTTELRARVFVEEQVGTGRVRAIASGFAEGLVAKRLLPPEGGSHDATGSYTASGSYSAGGSYNTGGSDDAVAEPQDLRIEFRSTRLAVTAGIGRVVWGRLDELQPTDVVNPLDLSRFFFEGRSEARLSVPLVRTTVFAGDRASLDAIYVPWFRRGRFDRLDEPSSPFNIAPRVGFVDRSPPRTAANGQGGARLNVTSGHVDWSVSAYRGFRPFGLYSAAGAIELTRVYPRFTMIGADVETVSGAWVVRGEAAAFVSDAFQAAAAPLVRTGSSFDAGGGLDRKAGAYRVSGQFLLHHEAYDAAPPGAPAALDSRGRTDVSLIASADRSFARERYTSRLFGVYNPRGGTGFVRGILTANLKDNLALEGSLGLFAGSGPDAVGRFSDSDFGYVRLKYFF